MTPADLERCASEPIHLPGSIQPHGCLLAFDPFELSIRQASHNVEEFLGESVDALLGRKLETVFPESELAPMREAITAICHDRHHQTGTHVPLYLSSPAGAQPLLGLMHVHAGLAILELERIRSDDSSHVPRWMWQTDETLAAMRLAQQADDLFQIAVEGLRAVAGLDRVMLYRFDADWNGEVVAEARDERLEPFLGLHYPASDIPAQARRLYGMQLVRYLPDIDYRPVPLVPLLRPDNGEPLDLSYAKLRSVSAVHIEYLQNMGVQGTFVISIMVHDRLWGLIACHHGTVMHMPYPLRRLMGYVAATLGVQIADLENQQVARTRQKLTQLREQLFELAGQADRELVAVFDELGPTICQWLEADGAVFWDDDAGLTRQYGQGLSPAHQHEQLSRVRALLQDRRQICIDRGETDDDADAPAGVAAVALSSGAQSGLLLWRRDVLKTVTWAGNPDKVLEPSADGLRLSPRRSFAAWQQVMRGRCQPWTSIQREWLEQLSTLSDRSRLKALTERLQLLGAAVEGSADSICITRANLDPPGPEIVYVNSGFTRMTGYEPHEVLGQSPRMLQGPDSDRRELARVRRELSAGRRVEAELINYRKDGSSFYIQWTISPLRDAQGRITHFVAVQRDVTARRATEEALRLASLVYEHSSEAMMVCDPTARIMAVNPAFTRITGYELAEVVDQDPRMMSSGRQPDSFHDAMWATLRSRGHWEGDVWNRRKDGSEYVVRLVVNAIRDSDGNITRLVALFSDITQQKRAEELIWRQANFDTLTGLPNRQLFMDRLQQEIRRALRQKELLALLFIDLDRFKEVNDTLGHNIGDALLVEAARRLRTRLRDSDTVSRLGGDEFTVILPGLRGQDDADRLAAGLLEVLSQPFRLQDEQVYVSASIGMTFCPNDGRELALLLKQADQAMYAAKRAGRNRVCHFSPDMQTASEQRLRLSIDLRNALAQGQLSVHFQPVVELSTGRVCKAEALVRWQHPQRGSISPHQFIPIAEETGLINDIGDWVFAESVRWAQRWTALAGGPFQISVNRSPVQFYSQAGHRDWVADLAAQGVPGTCINVEITEGLLLNTLPEVTAQLEAFQAAGMALSIDDFGTGYSSMAYLKKFDVDYIKIDRSFVKDMASDPSDRAIAEAIIVMAHKLGFKVIAEGVETLEQHRLLAAAGCDLGQGYLYARPMPPEVLEEQLLKQHFVLSCDRQDQSSSRLSSDKPSG
jgi:diguanylate cyclase (GGDEF)-like protein/PAS domain S-box-containing protein